MRFSKFSGKEVIDLEHGERLGTLGQSDLVIDPESGRIESIVLPGGSFLSFGRNKNEVNIPWRSIRKIGSDMIIVELNESGEVRSK